MIELNPLDVLGSRKLGRIPPHFSTTKLSDVSFISAEFEDWIGAKLKGRYCIRQVPVVTNEGHLKTEIRVGFEDEKELTYFMLACPHLRR